MRDRQTEIQQAFIRTCRDSGFRMPATQAAHFTANLIGCSALEIWTAFGTINVMNQIASGEHPATKETAK